MAIRDCIQQSAPGAPPSSPTMTSSSPSTPRSPPQGGSSNGTHQPQHQQYSPSKRSRVVSASSSSSSAPTGSGTRTSSPSSKKHKAAAAKAAAAAATRVSTAAQDSSSSGKEEDEEAVGMDMDASSWLGPVVSVLERQPQVLGPWLCLQDRLSLGLTCRRLLVAYDSYIRELALRARPTIISTGGLGGSLGSQCVYGMPTPEQLAVLPRLCVRFPKITTLHVRESAALPTVLGMLAKNSSKQLKASTTTTTTTGWPSLRTLCLKRLRLESSDVEELARIMDDGRLRSLSSLDLSDCNGLDADCIISLAEVLARGGTCPALVDLNLRSTASSSWSVLAAAASAATTPATTPSSMSSSAPSTPCSSGGDDGAMRVALEFLGVALQGRRAQGCRPVQRLHLGASCLQLLGRLMSPETLVGLRELDLSYASLTEAELMQMGDGLRNARAPQLEVLRVGGAILVPESGRSLANALLCGGAPRLRVLDLEAVGMGGRAMGALAAAMELGACNTLRELTLAKAGLSAADVEQLMTAAQSQKRRGGGPEHLKTLALNRNRSMGAQGATALARALAAGTFPYLETLNLQDTNIGDAGVCDIAAAMGSAITTTSTSNPDTPTSNSSSSNADGVGGMSGGSRLKKLLLGSCQVGVAGAAAIGSLLATGTCPRLEVLSLSLNRLGASGVAQLATALGTTTTTTTGPSCYQWSRLRVLELNFVEMGEAGARALMVALGKPKAVPELDRVEVLQWTTTATPSEAASGGLASRTTVEALKTTLQRRKTTNSKGWPVYVVV